VKVGDLSGPARQLFEAWRAAGKTEAQALEEVHRSGIARERTLEELIEARYGRAGDTGGGGRAGFDLDAAVEAYRKGDTGRRGVAQGFDLDAAVEEYLRAERAWQPR
jgi:hypothetical protein